MKILVAGYYGFGNLGDELILSSIISQLQQRYEKAEISVLSNNPKETSQTHHVQSLSRWSLLPLVWALWRNDFMVLGGGGLLQNKTSQRSLFYYLGLVGISRLLGTPVVLFAMGVEVLNGKFARWLTRVALQSALITVTVRDEASRAILRDIGLRANFIYLTADPVFARQVSLPRQDRFTTEPDSVLLVPRFPCPLSGRTIFALFSRILRDDKKLRVKGMLFEPSSEVKHLRNLSGHPILSEDEFLTGNSMEENVGILAQHSWVVSARFHGLVLAAIAGKPFIGIGDFSKVGRICELLGMPFLSWDADENEIQDAIDKVQRKKARIPVHLVDQLRAAALETANHLQ